MNSLDISNSTTEGGRDTEEKDYQSLFWLPMMYQTVDTAVNLLDDMLEDIDEFQRGVAEDKMGFGRDSGDQLPKMSKKKRQQILGDDSFGNEIIASKILKILKN